MGFSYSVACALFRVLLPFAPFFPAGPSECVCWTTRPTEMCMCVCTRARPPVLFAAFLARRPRVECVYFRDTSWINATSCWQTGYIWLGYHCPSPCHVWWTQAHSISTPVDGYHSLVFIFSLSICTPQNTQWRRRRRKVRHRKLSERERERADDTMRGRSAVRTVCFG